MRSIFLLLLLPLTFSLNLPTLQTSLKTSHSFTLSPSITISTSTGLCLKSLTPLSPSTLILTLPSSSSISTCTPINIFDVPKLKTFKEWNILTWQQRLSFKLSNLPDSEYKLSLPSTFQKWIPPKSYPLSAKTDDEKWMKLVNSRTFSSSPLPIFNPIPPLTLTGLSVLSYFLGVTTINQIADASGLILCYIIFQDFILPKFGDKKVHKILPGIDYINHSNEPNSEVKLNYFTGNHEVVTTKEIGKGEEITISYGKKSNDQLLEYYNFYIPNNEYDTYSLRGIGDWDSFEGDFEGVIMGRWIVARSGVEERLIQTLRKVFDSSSNPAVSGQFEDEVKNVLRGVLKKEIKVLEGEDWGDAFMEGFKREKIGVLRDALKKY